MVPRGSCWRTTLAPAPCLSDATWPPESPSTPNKCCSVRRAFFPDGHIVSTVLRAVCKPCLETCACTTSNTRPPITVAELASAQDPMNVKSSTCAVDASGSCVARVAGAKGPSGAAIGARYPPWVTSRWMP
eukprot:8768834-Pyramimonas_sp.AAC.1